jgi:hypothetical protein
MPLKGGINIKLIDEEVIGMPNLGNAPDNHPVTLDQTVIGGIECLRGLARVPGAPKRFGIPTHTGLFQA